MNCTIRVAKTKTQISFAVTAKLICVFVFAYADCWFSHEVAHMLFLCFQSSTTSIGDDASQTSGDNRDNFFKDGRRRIGRFNHVTKSKKCMAKEISD